MHAGRLIFSQLLDFLPPHPFNLCVRRYGGNRKVSRFSCRDQFLCMAFSQLTYCESLREIVIRLQAMRTKLYHVGVRGSVSRSTLADANEVRDWRIYADFAAVLIAQARALYAKDSFGLDLDQTVYAFDSTTIDLCLSLFPWAQFRRHKSAVKLHTLIDLRGNIPCFVHVSSGSMADVRALDLLPIEPGAFYILDRGYIDFARPHRFTQGLAFFVTRAKRPMDYARRDYRPVDKTAGLRGDSTIILCGPKSARLYPDPLRRVSYHAVDIDKHFVFLTNNFALPALTIAQLYRCRWQVELFFKWIKQNLRIKAFYGTSDNAVKTQIWIAICVYVLVAIVKKELKLERSMAEIPQILCVSLFENMPILQALSQPPNEIENGEIHKQLSLFN